jgi:hypothetical protein
MRRASRRLCIRAKKQERHVGVFKRFPLSDIAKTRWACNRRRTCQPKYREVALAVHGGDALSPIHGTARKPTGVIGMTSLETFYYFGLLLFLASEIVFILSLQKSKAFPQDWQIPRVPLYCGVGFMFAAFLLQILADFY